MWGYLSLGSHPDHWNGWNLIEQRDHKVQTCSRSGVQGKHNFSTSDLAAQQGTSPPEKSTQASTSISSSDGGCTTCTLSPSLSPSPFAVDKSMSKSCHPDIWSLLLPNIRRAIQNGPCPDPVDCTKPMQLSTAAYSSFGRRSRHLSLGRRSRNKLTTSVSC